MAEETPTPTPRVKRRPAWHPKTIAGAFLLGQRPDDQVVREKAKRTTKTGAKVTALGLVGWALMSAMNMVGGLLKAQTKALQDLPGAVAQAIKERDEASVGDAAWVVGKIEGLEAATAMHRAADAAEFAQLRGVVSGRLRCPPCPVCTPCPPAAPAPTSSWRPTRER